MHGTLLHEKNDLVLNSNRVVDVVIQLDLQFVLKLTVLLQNFLLFYGVSEVFIVFSK